MYEMGGSMYEINVALFLCKIRAQIAEAFFNFAKCQHKLQRHFSILRNASANCRSIFHFCKMPAQIAETFFIFAKCQHKLQKHFLN